MSGAPCLRAHPCRPPSNPPRCLRTTQASVTAQPPDYTFQQLSSSADNASLIPGDMIFSTFTWFGATGAAVTFTATPPPGAPSFVAPPRINVRVAAPVPRPNDGPITNTPSLGGGQGPSGSGDQSMSGWKIGLVVGLVVGALLILGLILGFVWKRRRGGSKGGGKYAIKVHSLRSTGTCTSRSGTGEAGSGPSSSLGSGRARKSTDNLIYDERQLDDGIPGAQEDRPVCSPSVATMLESQQPSLDPNTSDGGNGYPPPPVTAAHLETQRHMERVHMGGGSPRGPVSSGTVALQQLSLPQEEDTSPPLSPDNTNTRREIQRQMEDLHDELRDGQSQWEVHEQIGKGGYGVVYKVGDGGAGGPETRAVVGCESSYCC